jgi:hypothetical protein
MLKRYLSNPSFLFLLAGNLYCIWYFENHPEGFSTIVWIYWLQSIIIGFFNFIDLLTISNYDASEFKMNNAPVTAKNKGCVAWFFLFHYGMFHLVYCIFLLADFGISKVDGYFLLLGVATFFMETLVGFIRRKRMEQDNTLILGRLFMLPYLRVVPMHLMILLPAFLGVKASVLFLVLKTVADILSFIAYQHIFKGKR